MIHSPTLRGYIAFYNQERQNGTPWYKIHSKWSKDLSAEQQKQWTPDTGAEELRSEKQQAEKKPTPAKAEPAKKTKAEKPVNEMTPQQEKREDKKLVDLIMKKVEQCEKED